MKSSKTLTLISRMTLIGMAFLLCFILAFGVFDADTQALAWSGQPQTAEVVLSNDQIKLPTGIQTEIDGETGVMYEYTLVGPGGITTGSNIGATWSADNELDSMTENGSIRLYRRGMDKDGTASLWSWVKLPSALSGLSSGQVKARLSYSVTIQGQSGAAVSLSIGSNGTCPSDFAKQSLYNSISAAAFTFDPPGGGKMKTETSEFSDWLDISSGNKYLQWIFSCIFTNDVNDLPSVSGSYDVSCQLESINLQLFLVNDGQGPNIVPWSAKYNQDANGDFVRSSDGVNFVPYDASKHSSDMTRYSVTSNAAFNRDDFTALTAPSHGQNGYYTDSWYNLNNGYVFNHDMKDDILDDGRTNSFLSSQRKEYKRISFIAYDFFAGIYQVTVDDNSGAPPYIIEPGMTIDFGFGEINSVSFGTGDAGSSGYRGLAVCIDFNKAGTYTITATDQYGSPNMVTVTIGGIDTESPEIPEIEIVNDSNGNYVKVDNGILRYNWIISRAEDTTATAVNYEVEILKDGSVIQTRAAIDANMISVSGELVKTVSLNLAAFGGNINGDYTFRIWATDEAGNLGLDDFSPNIVDGDNDNIHKEFTIQVDGVTPELIVDLGTYTEGLWSTKTVRATITVPNGDSVSSGYSLYYRIGTGEWLSAKQTLNFANGTDDTVYFKAVSGVGIESAEIARYIRVDTFAPMYAPYAANIQNYYDANTGTYGTVIKPYNLPLEFIPMFGVEEADEADRYIEDFKFKYIISAVSGPGGAVIASSATKTFAYIDGKSSSINLLDDGMGDYGYKRIEVWVEDQAGNSSAAAVYYMLVEQPELSVSIKVNEGAAKYFDGTYTVPESLFTYDITFADYDDKGVKHYVSEDEYRARYNISEDFEIDFNAVFQSIDAADSVPFTIKDIQVKVTESSVYASLYKAVSPSADGLAAKIMPVPVTVKNLGLENKIYDGTTDINLNNYTFVAAIDNVTIDVNVISWLQLNASPLTLDSPDAGNKTVTVAVNKVDGRYISFKAGAPVGSKIDNYIFDTASIPGMSVDDATGVATVELSGEVVPRQLVVNSIIVNNAVKQYDGTDLLDNASVTVLLQGINGDNSILTSDIGKVFAQFTAKYSDAYVAADKPITVEVTGIVDDQGNTSVNYTVTSVKNEDYTGEITKKTVTITDLFAENRVYDGTNNASFGARYNSNYTLDGIVDGDKSFVRLSYETAVFENKNAGQVYALFTGLALTNVSVGTTLNTANNYELSLEGLEQVGDAYKATKTNYISPKQIRATVSAESKNYTGTRYAKNPVISVISGGIVEGEQIVIGNPLFNAAETDKIYQATFSYADYSVPVKLLYAGYLSANAAGTASVKFIYGNYELYDASNALHATEKRYNVSFGENVYGEYIAKVLVGDSWVIYNSNNADHANLDKQYYLFDETNPEHTAEGVVRYTVSSASAADDGLYVVNRYIYEKIGDTYVKTNNYVYEIENATLDSFRTLSTSTVAPIAYGKATATITAVYVMKQDGTLYTGADGNPLTLDKVVYGGKTVVLSDGSKAVPYGFKYEISYSGELYDDQGTVNIIDLASEEYAYLNLVEARVFEPDYNKLSVGNYLVSISNAVCSNFAFEGRFNGVNIEIIKADLTVSVPSQYSVAAGNDIFLSGFAINFSGLQNNEKIANLLGKTPSVEITHAGQTSFIPSVGGVISGGSSALYAGAYDFWIDLSPEEGYSLANYNLVVSGDNYRIDGEFVVKKGALNITKAQWTKAYIAVRDLYYDGSVRPVPLEVKGLPTTGAFDSKFIINVYLPATDEQGAVIYENGMIVWQDVPFKSYSNLDQDGVSDAGTYKLEYVFSGSDLYENLTLTAVMNIARKEVGIATPVTNYEKIYDGEAFNLKDLVESLYEGQQFKFSTDAGIYPGSELYRYGIEYQYSTNSKFTDSVTPRNAGTYFARIHFMGYKAPDAESHNLDNYQSAYSSVVRITISKMTVMVSITSGYEFLYSDYFDSDGKPVKDEEGNEKVFKGIEFTVSDEAYAPYIYIEYYHVDDMFSPWNEDLPTTKGDWSYRLVCVAENVQMASQDSLTGVMKIGDSYVSTTSKLEDGTRVIIGDILTDGGSVLSSGGEMQVTYYGEDMEEWIKAANLININKSQISANNPFVSGVYNLSYYNNQSVLSNKFTSAVTVSLRITGYDYNDASKFVRVDPVTGALIDVNAEYITYDGGEVYATFTTTELGTFALVNIEGKAFITPSMIIIIAVAGGAVVMFAVIMMIMLIVSGKMKKQAVELMGGPIDERGIKKQAKKDRKAGRTQDAGEETSSEGENHNSEEDKPEQDVKPVQPTSEVKPAQNMPEASARTAEMPAQSKSQADISKPDDKADSAGSEKPAALSAAAKVASAEKGTPFGAKPAAPAARPQAPGAAQAKPAAPAARPQAPGAAQAKPAAPAAAPQAPGAAQAKPVTPAARPQAPGAAQAKPVAPAARPQAPGAAQAKPAAPAARPQAPGAAQAKPAAPAAKPQAPQTKPEQPKKP